MIDVRRATGLTISLASACYSRQGNIVAEKLTYLKGMGYTPSSLAQDLIDSLLESAGVGDEPRRYDLFLELLFQLRTEVTTLARVQDHIQRIACGR